MKKMKELPRISDQKVQGKNCLRQDITASGAFIMISAYLVNLKSSQNPGDLTK